MDRTAITKRINRLACDIEKLTKNALWLIGISFDSDAKSDVLKETDRSN